MTMQFKRLQLGNWKNFTHVDVALARRVFIVGPNASGKSNLLDAIRFLRDLVTEGGGLNKAVEVRDGLRRVRSLFARKQPEVRIAATVTIQDGILWDYDLAFTHRTLKDQVPNVVHEEVYRTGAHGREQVLKRPDQADRADPERLRQTAIQQVTANQEFRELAEFFRNVSYIHVVPHLMREGIAAPMSAIGEDPFGRDLLKRIRAATNRTRQGRLTRIEKVLRVVTPQLKELALVQDDDGRPHLQAKFKHWRPQGAFQRETQFSDGTLRLIGLLWALQEKSSPLLLEEPELSLHAAIVKRLAPFIYRAQRNHGRQVLLSTHSIDLLADEGIAPEEILLVQPGDNGSEVFEAASAKDIRQLMEASVPASEVVIPRTQQSIDTPLFDGLEV
jgi:predicted ATPase